MVQKVLPELDEHSQGALWFRRRERQHHLTKQVLLIPELNQYMREILKHQALEHDLGVVLAPCFVLFLLVRDELLADPFKHVR